MFNFFRRKTAGKHENGRPKSPESSRTPPTDKNNSVSNKKPTQVTNETREKDNATLTRKDVVNLLIPPTDYGSQKSGVTAIFQNIMAGNRRRNRNKHKNRHKTKNELARAESYKEISTEVPEEMQSNVSLYRSHSQLDKSYVSRDETLSAPVSASDLTYDVVESKNNFANEQRDSNDTHADSPADFVKELVLSKYKNKSETKRPHVSLIYVSNDQECDKINAIDCGHYEVIAPQNTLNADGEVRVQHADYVEIPFDNQIKDFFYSNGSDKKVQVHKEAEKQRAEFLLQEIAKQLDCEFNANLESMGASDSKSNNDYRHNYANYKEENESKTSPMSSFKDDLKNELDKLLQNEDLDKEISESSAIHEFIKPDIQETLITGTNENEVETEEEEEVDDESEEEQEEIEIPNKILPDVEENKFLESSEYIRKSNLKPPRSDTEGCSDDDKSDCGKRKVTFRKTIEFDDGDEQTDVEVDSSFESLTSSEEEVSDSDSELPDNNELLGGVVVSRSDDKIFTGKSEVVITEITDEDADIKGLVNVDSNDCEIIIKTCEESDSFNSLTSRDKTGDFCYFKSSADTDDVKCSETEINNLNVNDEIQRINSDNSDSGFIEFSEKVDVKVTEESASDSEGETEEVTDDSEKEEQEEEEESIAEGEEEVEEEEEEEEEETDAYELEKLNKSDLKTLVSQEDKFQAQVEQLSELANTRCGEAERVREQLARHRKEIEARDQEIERLKCELAAAYKESEMIRQRSRSLEDELVAARSCSAHLADKLTRYNDGTELALRTELESTQNRAAELESKVLSLEKDKARLEQERHFQEQKATEAIEAAEASSQRWKAAHEAARSQASARAEILLADCEWKMRELEKRARDAEKQNADLKVALQKSESDKTSSPAHQAELQQLRGLLSEQHHSVQALSTQLQRLEGREEALKVEVHRLRELLEREATIAKEKEERYTQTITRLEQQHTKRMETVRSELTAQHAATRATLERAHADRTRNALTQLRLEHEKDCRNAERKLREAQNRFDNLKEVLASKEAQFEESMAETRSKADWDLLQLRHILDKADITYANNIEELNERHEKECERLNAEWTGRLEATEQAALVAAGDAKTLLERTRCRMEADKLEQVNRLKEQHRKEMDEQWERFMFDKEACLARMKLECRQEGEEERTRREKDMIDEIAELKEQIASKAANYEELSSKAASCGRTLAVTEQELREALEREKQLRSQRSEDADKLKQAKKAAVNDVEHLQRKCACLRKLFDDMRARLALREKVTAEESRLQQREIQQLKAEVARLTKILVEQSSPKLGARTRADGCDCAPTTDESFFSKAGHPACESQPCAPRRKGGGSLRTPELPRKRSDTTELRPLAFADHLKPSGQDAMEKRRAKSVDLPAVQVPCRIRQLEDMNK